MRFLTHLSFTGEQFIHTGFCPSGSSRVLADAEITSDTLGTLFGARSSYRTDGFALYISKTYLQDDYGSHSANIPVSGSGRHLFEKRQNTLRMDDIPLYISPEEDFSCSAPLTILALNSGGSMTTGLPVTGKLYSVKIYDGDNLLMDLIPALSDDDQPGLYDKCTGKFYPSASATPFLPGEPLQRTFTAAFPGSSSGCFARVYPIGVTGSMQAEGTQLAALG